MTFDMRDHLDKLEPDGGKNNAKGDHLYFDPNYSSEYNHQFDKKAKQFMEEYLKNDLDMQK